MTIQQKIEEVQKGNISAYPIAIEIDLLIKELQAQKDTLKPYVVDELENNGEALKCGEYTISVFNPRTTFTYDHNEDWSRLESKIKEIKREQKKIVKQMEFAYKNCKTIIDESTGEVFEAAKYKSGGGTSYSIKKSK